MQRRFLYEFYLLNKNVEEAGRQPCLFYVYIQMALLDTVMEELRFIDQASILTIDFCLFHHDIVLLCKTRVLMV